MKKKHKRRERMGWGEATVIIVLGLLMGTVFLINSLYWNAPVERSQAIEGEAVFSHNYIYVTGRSQTNAIVRFQDREQLSIPSVCVNDQLLEALDTLTPGETISLVIHPNSSTLLALASGDRVLLDFDRTQAHLRRENIGFACFAIFLYGLALYAAITPKKGSKKHESKPNRSR